MKYMFCDNAGMGHYTYKLCNALAKNKNLNIVYLTDNKNYELSYIDNKVCVLPVISAYRELKRKSIQWFFDRLSLPFRMQFTRDREIAKERPDVIFFQTYFPIFDQYDMNRMKKHSQIILTVHNVIPHEKTVLWNMKSLKRMYHNADKLIVHTEENKEELITKFSVPHQKIRIINHGTDVEYSLKDKDECRKKLDVNDDLPVLLVYGGIRDYKGIDIVIQAVKDIKCHLVIAGAPQAGTDFNIYQKLIEENNVDAICYIERVSNEFSDILFQACDYVVFPYKEFHSQSGVLMEAIKYGKPVIATNVGSFKRFISKYQMGFVCESNNVEALNKCIQFALKHIDELPDLRQLSKEFSWEASANMYLGVANEKSNI